MARNEVAADRDSKRKGEELTGIFDSIRWQNDDGSFIIAQLQCGKSIKGNAKPAAFIRGCKYTFGGTWEAPSGRYAATFKFVSYHAHEPVTPESVTAYLERHLSGSGAGIASVGIRKLIAQFGVDATIGVIKNEPKNVASFLGLTKEKAELASQCLKNVEKFERTRIELTQLFEKRGFPQATIEACIDVFGIHAAAAIKRDPFTMLVRDFPGCGFQRVNALYESFNLPKARLKRQVICLWHMLTEGNGSVWYSAEWARGELFRMVSSDVDFKRAVRMGKIAKWLSVYRDADNKPWIASYTHASCESQLADMISGLLLPQPDVVLESDEVQF